METSREIIARESLVVNFEYLTKVNPFQAGRFLGWLESAAKSPCTLNLNKGERHGKAK